MRSTPLELAIADVADISGFYFFQDAGSYTPPDDLAEFLKLGKPPVYIG